MPSAVLTGFRQLIGCSEGMILVTGPTGSGKTTTLYSALCELKSDEVNIMTIEDPVEYRLPGVAQIGVHPKIGLTFATGLRHILRQDPDIIMIGEIRDKETAEIAIQSALTGHLVLCTLHTNDACSAVTRLVDMGIEPYLISSCCLGVIAQRLVRRVCPSCHQKNSTCPVCVGSGFMGRHGMYELMTMTSKIKKQIASSPEAGLLREIAIGEGMQTLGAHGKTLVEQGITTPEEVWRVTRGGEIG
jgi:general secretion pathway protein E